MYYISNEKLFYKRTPVNPNTDFIQISSSGPECYAIDTNNKVWCFNHSRPIVATTRLEYFDGAAYIYRKSFDFVTTVTTSGGVMVRNGFFIYPAPMDEAMWTTCGTLCLNRDGDVFNLLGIKRDIPRMRDMTSVDEINYLLDFDGNLWESTQGRPPQMTKISGIVQFGIKSMYDQEGNIYVDEVDEFYKVMNLQNVKQLAWHRPDFASGQGHLYVLDQHNTLFKYKFMIEYEDRVINDDVKNYEAHQVPVFRLIESKSGPYAENVTSLPNYRHIPTKTKSART